MGAANLKSAVTRPSTYRICLVCQTLLITDCTSLRLKGGESIHRIDKRMGFGLTKGTTTWGYKNQGRSTPTRGLSSGLRLNRLGP